MALKINDIEKYVTNLRSNQNFTALIDYLKKDNEKDIHSLIMSNDEKPHLKGKCRFVEGFIEDIEAIFKK